MNIIVVLNFVPQKKKTKKENQDKKLDEDHPDAKWYIVSAHSGFEEKAIETIKKNAKKASLAKLFCDFSIYLK